MDDLSYNTVLQDGDILGGWGWDFTTIIPVFGVFFPFRCFKKIHQENTGGFLDQYP